MIEVVDCHTAVLRVADDISHPLKGVTDEFILVFGLDESIVEEANGNMELVAKLTALAVMEPIEMHDVVRIDGMALFPLDAGSTCKILSGRMLPYGTESQAREFLAQYDEEQLPVFVTITDNSYLGRAWDGDSYTIFSGLESAEKLQSVSDDGHRFTTNHMVASYDMFGAIDTPGSYVGLQVSWDTTTVPRMLSVPSLKPAAAALLVRGEFMNNRSESIGADTSLRVLKTIEDLNASIEIRAEQLEVSNEWKSCVQNFISSAQNGSLFAEEDVCDSSTTRDLYFKKRHGLDFSELFWDLIILRSSSLKEMFRATKWVLEAVLSQQIVPFIHKKNPTLFARISRLSLNKSEHASQGFPAKLEGKILSVETQEELASFLVEIGKWKVMRDFDAWFETIGLQNMCVKSDLLYLTQLRNSLLIARTVLCLRCSPCQVRTLVTSCLHELNIRSSHKCPLFALPLTGELQWVKDDATGVEPLPPPKLWQISQSTRGDKIVYFTRANEVHVFAGGSISNHAARKSISMLETDSTTVIRNFLGREYEQTHPASKSSLLSIKAAHVALF